MAVGFGSGGPVVAAGRVVLRADNQSLKGDLNQAESTFQKTGARLGTAAKAAGVAMAAGIGLAAVGLKKSVDAAIEAEKSQAQMEAALKRVGIAYQDHAKQIDTVIQKQSRLAAVDDEEVQDSFTRLVRVTGDVNKALQANAVALDLARGRNIDLGTAGKVVEKVLAGNTGILSRYGIEVEKGASVTEALGAIQEKYAGAAEAYGNTTAGAVDKAKIALENVGERVGSAVLPVLAKLATAFTDHVIPAISDLAGWLGDKLAPVFDAVKDAIGAVINFVRDNWPKIRDFIVPIVEAIADRLRAIWDVISGVVKAVWEGISQVISDNRDKIDRIVGFLKDAFQLLGDAIKFVLKEVIKPVAEFVFGTVIPKAIGLAIDAADFLVTAFQTARDLVTSAFNVLKNGVLTALGFVVGAVADAIEFVADLVEGVGELIDKIPGLGNPFEGVAGKIRGAADNVSDFQEELENLKSKDVGVTITYDMLWHGPGPGADGPGPGGEGMGLSGDLTRHGAGATMIRNHREILERGDQAAVQRGLGVIRSTVPPPGSGAAGLNPVILDELALGQIMGLHLISGYRPGATTVNGGVSAHAYGRAIDMSAGPATGWNNPTMRAFALAMPGRPGIDEVILGNRIWNHRGWHQASPLLTQQHMDHVHVADYIGGDGYGRGRGGDGYGLPDFPVGATLGHVQIAKLLYNKGFRGDALTRGVAVVLAESSGNWSAVGDGGRSFGGWQFYTAGGLGDGHSPGNLKDPEYSTALAFQHVRNVVSRFQPWSTHWNGAADSRMGAARAAVAAMGSPTSSGSSSGASSSPAITVPAWSAAPAGSVAAQIGWPSESEFVAMKRIAQKAAAQRTTAEKNLFEKFADWRAAHPGWPQWPIEEYRRRKQDVYAAQVPPDLGFPPSGGHQIPPEGDGDVGGGGEGGDTGTGGGTGGGDTGGGGTGGTIDIEAQIAAGVRAQLNAFLGARSAQFADLAPNIFTPTGEGLGLGSSGPLRSVTVIQNFPTPPDDQFALLRHVAFAAGAHVGR